jgi:starch synthase
MDSALQHRRNDLYGIINGADYDDWNPAIDQFLGANTYDAESFVDGKAACKRSLQQEMCLPIEPRTPLVAIVSRLADQKGLDLIVPVMQQWTADRNVQWVVLGTGEPRYHQLLGQIAGEHHGRAAVRLEFSNELAHRIEAGADIFVMPSQYEPCGLNQLYSLKYGTVPVVRATGGLADTVVNATPESMANGTATGFNFTAYTASALDGALHRACDLYNTDSAAWHKLISTGMRQDWSWGSSARQYSELYEKTLAKVRQGVLS